MTPLDIASATSTPITLANSKAAGGTSPAPVAVVLPQPVDTFISKQKVIGKPINKLKQATPPHDEKRWLLNGAAIVGGLSLIISSLWLWIGIDNPRFFKPESIHSTIPMATVGGVLAGGAFGILLCRFVNSVKHRLNGTTEEAPEAIVSIPASSY